MFDRLIESESADLKPRSKYFIVSSIVVGLLFVAAVVFSIYASEIGLGTEEFEVAGLIAPPETVETEPDPPQLRREQTAAQTNDRPSRVLNQQRPEETPTDIPPVSVTKPQYLSRPISDFDLDGRDVDVPPVTGPVQIGPGTGSSLTGVSRNEVETRSNPTEPETIPPPIVKKPQPPKHLGIVNGMAITLPKPPYPAVAISTGVQGKVDVQVTIDESGKVVSAKAASGHPFLRGPAENAAWRARFTPTILNGNPVKVTGVIVYNFTRK